MGDGKWIGSQHPNHGNPLGVILLCLNLLWSSCQDILFNIDGNTCRRLQCAATCVLQESIRTGTVVHCLLSGAVCHLAAAKQVLKDLGMIDYQ